MQLRHFPGLAAVAVLGLGCQAATPEATLDTNDQKASYAIGLDVGRSLAPAGERLAMPALMRGIEDAMAEREPAIASEELQTVMQQFAQEIEAEQQQERSAGAAEALREGETFLAENAEKEGVVTSESGLQYEVLREGDGPRPDADDRVTIHYRGTHTDGTEFDTSYDGEPATFAVTGVIPGFSEGLQLMPVGSQYRFVIPGPIAYGEQGSPGGIGPNETLIFEVELLDIAQ